MIEINLNDVAKSLTEHVNNSYIFNTFTHTYVK